MQKAFIHTNNKQLLGALLAKYAIERALPKESIIQVEILNVDNLDIFKAFAHKEYNFYGKPRVYNPEDLQSFTLSRFMPPELMNYEGRSIVIDPDIFAIRDITPLMNMELDNNAVAACSKKDAWDSSVMVMDNSKLRHWKMKDFLQALEKKQADYADIVTLKFEPQVKDLSREWNSLDHLSTETKLLHTTNRLTQPWRTGLPIDFTPNPLPKLFGIIPREPIHKILGKYPTKYLAHPDKKIEAWFLKLVADALKAGAVKRTDIQKEIDLGHVRKDLLTILPA
jgi:hypothetical protein